ncbi:MAG: hypothetical protein ACOZCO_03865 [Bacteroidota bacterium]
MLKRHYIFLVLVLLLYQACKKNNELPEEELYVRPVNHTETHTSDSLIAAFLFQPGTYWVYKNPVDNSSDSVFIHSISDLHYGCSSGGPYGNYSHDDYYKTMNLSGVQETDKYYLVGNTFCIYFGTCAFSGSIFEYDQNSLSGVGSGEIEFYDSLLVESTWYYDVSKTRLNVIAPQQFALFKRYNGSCFYINRQYGIVKKELMDKEGNITVLNLVNSQIIR